MQCRVSTRLSRHRNVVPHDSSHLGYGWLPVQAVSRLIDAFVLLNSMLIREEESLSSCSFVAVVFRVCQAMGLHKDGTNFGLDEVQVEERKKNMVSPAAS